jgi:COMPASS component SPP1
MASRRLAISSLLCDSDPPDADPVVDPVVLAPHLRATTTHHRQHHSPTYIGLEALVHAATEERRRLSVGSSTDTEAASPLIHESFPRSHQPRSHHRSPSRQPDHYQLHSPTVSPPYDYTIPSPFSPPSRHRTQDRLVQDDSQLRLRPVDDIHHRPAYFPTPPLPPTSHPDHEVLLQQQQLELLRQRQHHEQLLLKEQQQQRQFARERHLAHTSASPSLPPPPRVPSVPLHLQPPSPHFSHPHLSPPTAGRKLDPGQHMTEPGLTSAHFNLILSPKSPVPDDHPTKKRRYSDSPILPMSSAGRERISPIRDNSATTDFTHSHVDPLVAMHRSPTPPSANEQKPTTAAEIVIPDREKEKEKERVSADARESLRGGVKSVARRPSPGSQIGKAKAARKSEEKDASLGPRKNQEGERQHAAEEPNQDNQRSRTRPAIVTQTTREAPNSRVKPQEIPRRSRQSTTPPPTKSQDAHEWLLEHYDDPPDEPAASPPPPILSPVSQKQMSTPATMPEAAVALEQELEDLVVNFPTIPGKIEPETDVDMDVDFAVTELVAETLEQDSVPHINVGMEVEVEDELLSLLDDRPSVPRRTSGPISSTKHPPFQAGSSDARQGSPSAVSNVSLSGNVSPAIRSLSARPMSERESMPPPTSVAPSRGKDKSEKKTEHARSATATAPTTKKKKDVASKVCPPCVLYLLLVR